MALAAVLAACYLLGTFPTARVVAARAGHDPHSEGSGNPGASNVYRVAGRRAGFAVFLGDVLKGVAAAGAGLLYGAVADLGTDDARLVALAAGGAAVLGHVVPVVRKGGRGVAAAGGTVIVVFPIVAAAALAAWIVVARGSGKASLASLVTVAVTLGGVAVSGAPTEEVVAMTAISAVIVARHAENIRRLVGGDERTLDTGPTPDDAGPAPDGA